LETEFKWFVGIDWGGEYHQVCVLDHNRRIMEERSVKHDGEGIGELIRWVGAMVAGEPATMAAALEVPHGPIVEALLACGIAVFSINPKQVDRFRDRYTVNGAKDDRRDAYVIASSLLSDRHAFKRLTIESPLTLRIRELSRTLDDLDNDRRRLTNQLRDLLIRYFPAILALCPAVDEPWIWALLKRGPAARQGEASHVQSGPHDIEETQSTAAHSGKRYRTPTARVPAGCSCLCGSYSRAREHLDPANRSLRRAVPARIQGSKSRGESGDYGYRVQRGKDSCIDEKSAWYRRDRLHYLARGSPQPCLQTAMDGRSDVTLALPRSRSRVERLDECACATAATNASEKLVITGLEPAFNGTATAGHIILGYDRPVTAMAEPCEECVIG
jgi:hypothetical protein